MHTPVFSPPIPRLQPRCFPGRLAFLVFLFAATVLPLNAALSPAQSEVLYSEMLRDPQFKAADKDLSTLYSAIRKPMTAAEQAQIRDQQREWLKSTYETIANVAPPARAALGARLTRQRIQELRQTSSSSPPSQSSKSLPAPPAGNGAAAAPGSEPVNVNASLAKLKSKDPDKRLEALRELEYSLDPRLPGVMLGLLSDVGDTTRSVAEHGIGSRWWQIPKDQVGVYIARLKKANPSGEGGQRSIELLEQSQGKRLERPQGVSLSPNGRWIIYDRRGLPCLIEVQSQSEELLGHDHADREGRFMGAAETVRWHPTKEMVAIPLSTRRGTASLVIWGQGAGTRVINKGTLIELLQKRKFKLNSMMFSIAEDKLQWRGEKLVLPLDFETEDGRGHVATAVWSLSSGELVLEGVK